MTSLAPHSPTGGSPPLRAVPRLAFEIRRTIGAVTTDGFLPGYTSTEVTLLSGAALELQRDLGSDAFSVLLILAMAAAEESGRLVVDRATALVMEQTGWARPKTSKLLAGLEAAGFASREQARGRDDGGRGKFGTHRTWLSPALYQTVERRLTLAPTVPTVNASSLRGGAPDALSFRTAATVRDTDRPAGATRCDTGRRAAVTIGDTGPLDAVTNGDTGALTDATISAVTNGDTGSESPGQTEATVRDSGEIDQHHGYENEDELHSPRSDDDDEPVRAAARFDPDLEALRPFGGVDDVRASREQLSRLAGQTPELNVEEVQTLSPAQTVDLLKSWRVFGADQLVSSTPSRVLSESIATVTSRWGEIANPGAYLRQLLKAAERGAVPVPKTAAAPLVSRSGSPGSSRPQNTPDDGSADAVPSDVVASALSRLPPDVREQVEQAAATAVQDATWTRSRPSLAEGLRMTSIVAQLRKLEVLPADSDPASATG